MIVITFSVVRNELIPPHGAVRLNNALNAWHLSPSLQSVCSAELSSQWIQQIKFHRQFPTSLRNFCPTVFAIFQLFQSRRGRIRCLFPPKKRNFDLTVTIPHTKQRLHQSEYNLPLNWMRSFCDFWNAIYSKMRRGSHAYQKPAPQSLVGDMSHKQKNKTFMFRFAIDFRWNKSDNVIRHFCYCISICFVSHFNCNTIIDWLKMKSISAWLELPIQFW